MFKILKLLTVLPLFMGGVMSKSMAKKSVLSDTYSIYPTVQNITYSNNSLSLSNKVNIVFNDDVDVYTKEKALKRFCFKAFLVARPGGFEPTTF